MSKLTKQQKNTIRMALESLYNARSFVVDPTMHLVRESSVTVFPAQSWTNGEGKTGISINKEIGSKLVGLYRGIEMIEHMLKEQEQ